MFRGAEEKLSKTGRLKLYRAVIGFDKNHIKGYRHLVGRNEEKKMEHTPRSGEIYRHFKNKLYQVIAVARHTETEEELVIYQALYGTYGIYARPLASFTGEVDREKYPDVKQKNRLERVDDSRLAQEETAPGDGCGTCKTGKEEAEDGGQAPNPLLLSFVETRDFGVKLEILSAMEDKVSQEDVDILREALDLPETTGDIREQVRSVRQYLEMRKKFDNKRLR